MSETPGVEPHGLGQVSEPEPAHEDSNLLNLPAPWTISLASFDRWRALAAKPEPLKPVTIADLLEVLNRHG